jgi:hypothetical protein
MKGVRDIPFVAQMLYSPNFRIALFSICLRDLPWFQEMQRELRNSHSSGSGDGKRRFERGIFDKRFEGLWR